jgi:hypothetical protein
MMRADSEVSAAQCRATAEQEIAKEQRLYRSVVFGYAKAEAAKPGEVKFDQEGNAWIKTGENTWRSVAKGLEETTWSDEQMRSKDELSERRGILDTRRLLTSDLVPYLTQAFRALQCRAEIICATVESSIGQESKQPQQITLLVPGCIKEERSTFPTCHLLGDKAEKAEEGDVLNYCRLMSAQLLDREEDLLKLTVEYDAAYRSLLQISGMLDSFLEGFRWPIVNSLRKTVELVGSFQRIPCFAASCDEAPSSP